MFTSIANPSKWTTTAAIALFGLLLGTEAQAAGSSTSTDGPMIKNVMALTYRAPSVQPDQSRGLTKREVKRLSAAAESANDHLMLAAYYQAEAERLDAQASGYERAAATYRNGPMAKNLMAPSTLDRYEFLAKGLRDESRSDRTLATAQEEWPRRPALRCSEITSLGGYVAGALPALGLNRRRGQRPRSPSRNELRRP